jgi:hypothetical protein
LQALVMPASTELGELLDAYEGVPDTPARRRRFIEDYLDYLLRHRRLIAYMARDLAGLAHVLASAGGDWRERVEAMVAGDELDFHEQVRIAMAFRGIGAAIAQYPDADTAVLREALLDATRALLRTRPRRQSPVTITAADAPPPNQGDPRPG